MTIVLKICGKLKKTAHASRNNMYMKKEGSCGSLWRHLHSATCSNLIPRNMNKKLGSARAVNLVVGWLDKTLPPHTPNENGRGQLGDA